MKVIKIEEVGKEFKDLVELKEHCVTMFQALKTATEKLLKQEEEITQLQKLLGESVPILQAPVVRIEKSHEELICELELEKLYNESRARTLTLEETKRLDLLVKNLHVAREKNIKTAEVLKIPNGYSEAKLIEMARENE